MPNSDLPEPNPHGLPALLASAELPDPSGDGTAAALLALVLTTNRLMMLEALRAVPAARLTPPQFRILNFLLVRPGASLSEVAAHLGVRLPTASVMLVKLGRDGYVDRSRDPASRRRMRLVLTEQGRATILTVRQALFQRVDRARQKLSADEQDAVRQAVPALRRLFELA